MNIGRTASVKTRERFLRRQADWLKANRHVPVRAQQTHLRLALNGYYQYFGLRLCEQTLYTVYRRIRKLWVKWLRRRSQKARRTVAWSTLREKSWFQLPRPRVTQAWV
jgi:RNA-directed DNA polymerase